MKNKNAIDKIISELSLQDYKVRCKRLTKNSVKNIRTGKKTLSDYGGYTLSKETIEAIEIKKQYLADEITEEEYKSWCMKYNLRTV